MLIRIEPPHSRRRSVLLGSACRRLVASETPLAEDGLLVPFHVQGRAAARDGRLPLAKRLRERSELASLRSLFSGYGQAAARQRALAAGFDDHRVKPPPPDPQILRRSSAPWPDKPGIGASFFTRILD